MDLTTKYLGLNLKSPLVPSASPLSDEADNIRKMEDAGAAAVVLHSLFEEQVMREEEALEHLMGQGTESFAEAISYLPEPNEFVTGPAAYLEHVRKAKEAVRIPVIASLNGATLGGWTDYARQIEQAGADALELNIYAIPTDMDLTAADIEKTYLEILSAVRSAVRIPVAMKLSPYFTNMAAMAKKLDQAGVDGFVLFNRFYQPDIDLETLDVYPNVLLSTPHSLRLPLRWVAILYGRVKGDLAATSGIHSAEDVLKVLMAGASVAMLCSVLFQKGIPYIREIENGIRSWMTEHEYESVEQLRGSMSQKNCADPAAFERAQYMRALLSYKPAW